MIVGSHALIFVQDEDATRTFFRDVLGVEFTSGVRDLRWGRLTTLRIPGGGESPQRQRNEHRYPGRLKPYPASTP